MTESDQNPYESSPQAAILPERPPVATGVRLCAALLLVGGVSFLLTAGWAMTQYGENPALLVTSLVMAIAGVVSGYTGFHLWQGQTWAYKAGLILYVLQIPIINSGVITYALTSGLGLLFTITFGDVTNFGFNFYFGGNLQIWLGSGAPGLAVGINAVGAIGAKYLFDAIRAPSSPDHEPHDPA